MKRWNQMCGTIALGCYIVTLSFLWHLCQYGGIRKNLPPLALSIAGCVISFVLWEISRRKCQKEGTQWKRGSTFYVKCILFLGATIYFSGQIIVSAIPYHGALSWKIDEWKRKKEISLEHTNLFKDGLDGILEDLDRKLHLPEELYINNKCQITFDKEGEIQSIDTFLYGKNQKGEKKTYLIDYDVKNSEKMTVWVDGNSNGTYEESMRLEPMKTILKRANWIEQVNRWAGTSDSPQIYELLYMGSRSFVSADGLHCVSVDADGYGNADGWEAFRLLAGGGAVVGFEISLHIPAEESITPVRYVMDPRYVSQAQLDRKTEKEQSQNAIETESWTVDSKDGTMYFFLDEQMGWRLVVTDAAAGSRFYEMDQTIDGGDNWNRIQKDPFVGSIGVAEGLIFYSKEIGIIGMCGASGSYSSLYLTQDGGKTFEQIQLPMEAVTSLPATAEEFGYSIEDYAYFNMPEKEGDILTIKVTTEQTEQDGIIFQSTDMGRTWNFLSVTP